MTNFAYMLAPIEDMTSSAFRTLCYKYGADLTFTEMVRIQSLGRNNRTSWERVMAKDDTPTQIQLIGNDEYYLKKFLSKFKPEKGFKGFNLNLGCPAPNFVNHGLGCAMIKRISKTKKIIKIIQDRKYSASIKMRLGLNEFEKEKKVYLNLINAVDADFFVIHARHGQQSYDDPPDFSVFEECVETGKTIIANGSIKTKDQVEFLKNAGVKGVMIGRAAIADPAIFRKLKGVSAPEPAKILKEYAELTEKYNEPFRYQKNILKRLVR